MPGFGESYVSPRIRLVFALSLSLVLTPLLSKTMPHMPSSPLALALLVAAEILTGLFIGAVCNIILSATHVAGMIFSFQSGLSSAVIYDVTQASQGSLVGSFMGLTVLVLVFSTDLHFLMLRGVTESYSVFVPGHVPPLNDFVEVVAKLVSETFIISVQIAAPLIVAGTLLFLGAGILTRLMPAMQVFFILMPAQILLNFFILMTTFSAMMLWFLEFYRAKLSHLLGYLQ